LHFMETEGERKGARREQEGRMNCVASEDIACDEGHGVGPWYAAGMYIDSVWYQIKCAEAGPGRAERGGIVDRNEKWGTRDERLRDERSDMGRSEILDSGGPRSLAASLCPADVVQDIMHIR
jgi:hypothetical protein